MIAVNNLTTNQFDKGFFKEVAKKVLMGENREGLELSIALVGQNRIRGLNKKYRQKNRTTDVLSFNYNNSGEVVICPAEVKKNAKRFKAVFEKELTKVLIHGLLHFLGYDHEKSGKSALKMAEKEKHYLDTLCPKLKS